MQNSAKDEIIYSASYTPWRVCLAFIVCAFFLCIFLALACSLIFKGSYLIGFLCLLAVVGALLLLFDALLSERLIFYSDRMERVWRIFGSKTIYYPNAGVQDTLHGMVWFFRTDPDGRPLRFKIPILVQDSLFSFKVGREVRAIIDYLTERKWYWK